MALIQLIEVRQEEMTPEEMARRSHFFLDGDEEAFAKIEVTSTEIDGNLQRADVWFVFKDDPERREMGADICTHECVWSCDFDTDAFDEPDEDKGIPSCFDRFGVDQESLENALLNFGEHCLGMYS